MSSNLDYTVDDLEERVKNVKKIIEDNEESLVDYYDNYYNPSINQNSRTSEFDIMSKDLQRMADYLLYADNKEKRKENHGEDFNIVSDNDNEKNKKKEYLLDDLSSIDKGEDRKVVHQHKLYKKVKVYKEDREKYPELRETGESIERMQKMVSEGKDSQGNRLSKDEIKKLKWIMIEVRKDEVAMKEILKGYIRFKRISPEESPDHQLDGFSFANKEHIGMVFENYAEFKQNSFDDTKGDMKLIIQVFEELVDNTDFEEYVKDILIYKIDGLTRREICDTIQESHGIVFSEERVSQITKEIIPAMIVDTYNRKKDDWIHTFIIRGKYKQCTRCGDSKLIKFFGKYSRSKDGLRNECKECRKN